MEKRVLVLGARGRLGRVLTRTFAGAGWAVVAQSRRAPADGLRPRVLPVVCDASETATLAEAGAGAGIVIHALNPAYTDWAAEAAPLARAATDVARRLGARLMFPGNVYNFGSPLPTVLDEDTPQRPGTRKGEIRRHLEACMQTRAEAGVPVTILRAGDFFGGPGTGSWFDMAIAKDLHRGHIVYPGPLDRQHSWAYLPDLAAAFLALAGRRPAAAFEVFHFEGHSLTGHDLVAGLTAAGRARDLLRPDQVPTIAGLPWTLLRVGGLLVPMWRELAEMRHLWTEPHRLDGSRLARAIGHLPTTPLAIALDEALGALGSPVAAPVTPATAV